MLGKQACVTLPVLFSYLARGVILLPLTCLACVLLSHFVVTEQSFKTLLILLNPELVLSCLTLYTYPICVISVSTLEDVRVFET